MRSICCALVAILSLMVLPAGAAVVTVTPDPQITDLPVGTDDLGETTLTHGWSIVSNRLGWGKLSTFGPALYQARNQQGNTPFVAGDPQVNPDQVLGRGTFYATCDMWRGGTNAVGDKTPSTVWLGTNTWKGQPISGRTLGSITEMSYYSFVDKCPTKYGGLKNELGWWSKPNWWGSVQQPIQIQLLAVEPNNTRTRALWYRPWGYNYTGDDGLTEPGSKKGRWQFFNCLTYGKWYSPSAGTTPNTVERGWESWSEMLEFQLPDGPLPKFREWKLVDPSNIWKSPGWDNGTNPIGSPTSTGTGMPLNFFVGARKTILNPLFLQGGSINYYNHSYGERAQVDYFTLGFEGEGSETYDFEPAPEDPPVRTVALNHKSVLAPIMQDTETKTHFLFKITGEVSLPEANRAQSFRLEDGSKLQYTDPGYEPLWSEQVLEGPIRIFLWDDSPSWNEEPLWIGPGDVVSAVGFIEPLRISGAPSNYYMMWTNINKLVKHQNY